MKKIIISILFLLKLINSFAQSLPLTVSVKTPELNAFNRSIETPVSKYTGVAEISIPLYEVMIKGVKVPITLDYHSGGIRVDQDATWVGLGWSLNYGGQISRKAKGIPDEFFYMHSDTAPSNGVNYFMQLPNTGSVPNQPNQEARYERMSAAKYGNSDYMPDEFYYSVLGYSGKFMFSQLQNKFILFPKEDIDIQKYYSNYSRINYFNMKLPDGISIDLGKDGYTAQEGRALNAATTLGSGWQIKTIRNNYNDSITYTYTSSSYRMYKIFGQQYKLHTDFAADFGTTISDPLINDSKVKLIEFPGGRIEFITQSREDMPGTALGKIVVYDKANNIVKSITFNYSYFYGNSYEILPVVNPIVSKYISDDFKNKRLKLDFLSITAPDNTPQKYVFDYYTLPQMPSKYSFSQDHWGFYNGAANMTEFSLIPNLQPGINGGDRSVKPDKSNVFTLKSVTFPEGGRKEFVYENNTAGIWNTPTELLSTYQDDNFPEKYAAISVSSYSRNTSYPAPDQSSPGVRYFRKQFTVGGLGFTTFSNGWDISTTFGISTIEQNSSYEADNVLFTLERINPDNSRTLIKSFNTTSPNYPNNNAPPRNGIDKSILGISAGNYEMTVKMTYLNAVNSAPDNQNYNLGFFIKWREMDPSKNMVNVGGLRIKDINYYDQNNVLVKRKSYSYTNPFANPANPDFTSGRVVSFPQYIEYRLRAYKDTYGVDKTDWIANFTSSSVLPLETTAGSYAGYEYVDESDVDIVNPQNNLKTASHFSFNPPNFSEFYLYRTRGLWEPKEWDRGKLLYTKYFRNSDLIKSEDYDYNYYSPHLPNEAQEDYVEEVNTDFISWQALKISCSCYGDFADDFYDTDGGRNNCVYFHYQPFNNHVITTAHQPILSWGSNPPISNVSCDYYVQVPYFKHFTAFDRLKSKITTTYDNVQNPVTATETYNYENTPQHYQLTKTTFSASDGKSVASVNKYPLDLTLSGSAETGRLKLVNNHQISTLLSQTKTKSNASLKSTTDYKVDPLTNLVVPDVVQTNTVNGTNEVRNVYHKFDAKGNLLSFSKSNGMITNYIWSYNGQYPIAEIQNSSYANIESILGKSNIDSFASTSPDNVAVNNFIAPLKLALPNAQIILYVYRPLVGLISMTDARGLVTTYEYDAFQRLKAVKDQNGNIIKSYNYHYKGQ